jgi:hypothetical protein
VRHISCPHTRYELLLLLLLVLLLLLLLFILLQKNALYLQSINQSALRILFRYAHKVCTVQLLLFSFQSKYTSSSSILSKSSYNLSFNSALILASCNSKHAAFAPAFIPAIYYKPVWFISISIYSPANDLYCKK